MAFRRFRRAGVRSFRRRRKWDMQEWTECERQLSWDTAQVINCQQPLMYWDLVSSPGQGAVAGTQVNAPGAGRGILWGGCRGQFQYHLALELDTSSQPAIPDFCHLTPYLLTALVLLPVNQSNPLLPAYLPNLMQSKSQQSVSYTSQSDNVESVLWRRYEVFRWASYVFQPADFEDECWPAISFDTGPYRAGGHAWIATQGTEIGSRTMTQGNGMMRAKVKRRVDDHHAIFITRQLSLGTVAGDNNITGRFVSRSWLQFALRTI